MTTAAKELNPHTNLSDNQSRTGDDNVYVKPLPRKSELKRELQQIRDLRAVREEQGPLVRQPAPAARLARVLHNAAQELWDACTYNDSAQMWEEARAIASRILAAAPGD